MAFPALSFEVAFTDPPGTVSPTWTVLSANRPDEFTTQRGRSMELDQNETGTLNVLLENQDRALDPLNTAGAYYPNVVPVRQCRMRATVLATTYDVFRGDIQDWPQDWKGRRNTVPLQVLDAFDALQIAEFTTSRPAELSGARVSAICDAIGWPSGLRSIDTGQALVQAIDYENANALQSLQDVAVWESGNIFVSRNGTLTFHNRHRRLTDTTLQATFSNDPAGGELPLADAKLVYRRERIRNSVFIGQNGGLTYSAEDATSKTNYRRRSLSQTVYLSNPNEVQAMAEWLRDLYKDPVVRIEEVTVEPQADDNLWAQALGREIGDRIRVKVKPPGSLTTTLTSDVTIEGVSHQVTNDLVWRTTFRCSPSNQQTYWILGTGELGDTSGVTATRLAY